jgi:D-beta-D-heptose 7-phosphate kinase/D-beta-D-heptose 1-phosphate adenosyltransferase
MNDNRPENIYNLEDLVKIRNELRLKNKKVVFTNGCFDFIHRGHIEYLKTARELGDFLVVAVNTDDSVRRLKGKGRPVNSEEDRALILAALRFVDAVCLFDEDTPAETISALHPDILVKGADYRIEEIVGHEQVLAEGGKVVPIPLVSGRSTTSIIEKIKKLPD